MEVNVTSQGRQDIQMYADSSVGNTQKVQTNDTKQNSIVEINKDKSLDNQAVSEKDAQKAVGKLNKLLEDTSTHVEYEHSDPFKSIMIMKVIDNNTNQVITEIPSRKIIDMMAQICEMAGLVLDKKA